MHGEILQEMQFQRYKLKIINFKNNWFSLYFTFLVIFVGFFLLNMITGKVANELQGSTNKIFQKEYILKKKLTQTSAD
jgi:hypothetical protein